jgi:hypothetical protein
MNLLCGEGLFFALHRWLTGALDNEQLIKERTY